MKHPRVRTLSFFGSLGSSNGIKPSSRQKYAKNAKFSEKDKDIFSV